MAQQSSKKPVEFDTKYEQVKSNRITIFKDKTIKDTPVYRIIVFPGDITRNGNRAEILSNFNSKNLHTYNYSWDFKISSLYYQREKQINHFIIAQWWNGPADGQTMADIKGKQGPPYYLNVVKKNGKLNLQIWYGLQGLNRNMESEFEINTDQWYHVEATTFWSTGKDGYSNISINGQVHHLKGPNKYNHASNVFKLGLYRNKNNKDTTEAFVKNINVNELTPGN